MCRITLLQKNSRYNICCHNIYVAMNFQRRGFEPLKPEGLPVYQTGVIGRSTTSPIQIYTKISTYTKKSEKSTQCLFIFCSYRPKLGASTIERKMSHTKSECKIKLDGEILLLLREQLLSCFLFLSIIIFFTFCRSCHLHYISTIMH